jgi:SAM-dependent methyltransferase
VLDVGCGCGSTTRDAARAARDGAATGIDLSTQMLELDRRRAIEEQLDNVTFEHGDAQVHDFGRPEFDVVISRFGAMFFGDPVAAFVNVGGAMRPGGRVALVAWHDLARNEWLTALRGALAQGRDLPVPPPRIPSPFAFADPDHVRAILAAAGFHDVAIDGVDVPFRLGADPDDAFDFASGTGIARGLLHDLPPDRQEMALADLRAVVDAHARPEGVVFGSRAWLITAVR